MIWTFGYETYSIEIDIAYLYIYSDILQKLLLCKDQPERWGLRRSKKNKEKELTKTSALYVYTI